MTQTVSKHSSPSLALRRSLRRLEPVRTSAWAIHAETKPAWTGAGSSSSPARGSLGGTLTKPGMTAPLRALSSISAFGNWIFLAACLLSLACSVPSGAQVSAPSGQYVGAGVCGSCHPSQFERQSVSGHARTLHRASEHPLKNQFVPPQPLRRPPKFRFRYQLDGEQIVVLADDNEYVMELPVEWAFGAGDHGVTFVSRLNTRSYLEHAFSYFSSAGSMDITPGHESIRPETLLQAMGLRYQVRGPGNAISNCFGCHSTGPLSYSPKQEVWINERGVRCESCHGPGGSHVDAMSKGDVARAGVTIRNPKQFAADDLLQFCGTCHRDPDNFSEEFDYKLAWNVRHQPPYFRKSRCFQRSVENLSCFTCHDPHEPVRRNEPDYYRERCMTCHEAEGRVPAETCEANRPSDCTDCHMPEVAVNSNLKFKNHWIGVYREEDPLIPVR